MITREITMSIKGWRRTVVIAVATAGSIGSVPAAATAATTAGKPGLPCRVCQTQPPAQQLPPGFYIEGNVLYNAAKQPVALPTGYKIVNGVIYDATGNIAVIQVNTAPANGATCTLQPAAPQPNQGGLAGLINGIVAGAINLGASVTAQSLCYAAQTTNAVVGPGGLLMLRITGADR
jgi:hypothetical protein